jgi:hypothetical protein
MNDQLGLTSQVNKSSRLVWAYLLATMDSSDNGKSDPQHLADSGCCGGDTGRTLLRRVVLSSVAQSASRKL